MNDKKGLFHEADGGTIFLDEIGSMSPMLQSRLLRVLQEREVRRVGENTPTYINVRVLAATNESLEKKIKDGSFREDLYYRLNVIPINMPSLRERRDDIPLLVAHFLRDKINPRTGHPVQITRQAMEVINAHDWPGNVRELENAIERAATLCDEDIIQGSDLPPALAGSACATRCRRRDCAVVRRVCARTSSSAPPFRRSRQPQRTRRRLRLRGIRHPVKRLFARTGTHLS